MLGSILLFLSSYLCFSSSWNVWLIFEERIGKYWSLIAQEGLEYSLPSTSKAKALTLHLPTRPLLPGSTPCSRLHWTRREWPGWYFPSYPHSLQGRPNLISLPKTHGHWPSWPTGGVVHRDHPVCLLLTVFSRLGDAALLIEEPLLWFSLSFLTHCFCQIYF